MYLRTVKRNLRTHLRTVKRKHMYFRTVKRNLRGYLRSVKRYLRMHLRTGERNLRIYLCSQTFPTYALTYRQT